MAQIAVAREFLSKCLLDLGRGYCELVSKDPQLTTRVEGVLRVAAYILPGRLGASQAVTELAYATTNLLTHCNDYILSKADRSASDTWPTVQRSLLYFLSLIDCFEVFVEFCAQQAGSEVAKWLTVFTTALIKSSVQCTLLLCYKLGMQFNPPIPFLDRAHLTGARQQQSQSWRGHRSGHVFRSINTDPSVPYNQLLSDEEGMVRPTVLSGYQLVAELLHSIRPLIHLSTMFAFGQKSWKPWLLSLLIDIASLQGLRQVRRLNRLERAEVFRRRFMLLCYLLRSPFYDKVTKEKMFSILSNILSKIPLLGSLAEVLLAYIPIWQQTYSYCWMT